MKSFKHFAEEEEKTKEMNKESHCDNIRKKKERIKRGSG